MGDLDITGSKFGLQIVISFSPILGRGNVLPDSASSINSRILYKNNEFPGVRAMRRVRIRTSSLVIFL